MPTPSQASPERVVKRTLQGEPTCGNRLATEEGVETVREVPK